MKLRLTPALALAGIFAALPLASAKQNQTKEKSQSAAVAAQAEPQGVTQAQEIQKFFHFRKDPEKGFIYIEPEPITQKIAEHLKQRYRIENPDEITEIIRHIDDTASQFNEASKSLKQIEIKLSDLGEKSEVPKPKDLDKLSDKELRDLINAKGILTPGSRDFLDSDLKIVEAGMQEGLVQGLSILVPIDNLQIHGFPVNMFAQGDIDIKEGSAKRRLYLDFQRGPQGIVRQLKSCVYLELQEPPGKLGNGGINGVVISESHLPAVISTKDKIYLIGLGEVQDKLYKEFKRKFAQHMPLPKTQDQAPAPLEKK